MSDVELHELRSIGVAVLDCEHKTPADAGSGFPYIAIPNLVDGCLHLDSVRRITKDHWLEWTKRTRPQAGDVIVTRRGRVGDTAVVPEGTECAIGQNLVILRSDGSMVRQEFLRWATRGPLWRAEVDRLRNVGAVFDSLNVRDIALLRIPVPCTSDQVGIAEVLCALDDKASMNRRETLLLESLIQSTWQRDCVPPRDGRNDGWVRRPIGEVALVRGGSTPGTTRPEFWDGGSIPWATPRDLSRLPSTPLLDTERHITPAGLTQISSGLLPAGVVLLSSRAPVGYLAIPEIPVAVNQGFIVLSARDDSVSNLFLWQWVRHNLQEVKSRANGTTFLEISKASFRPMAADLPPAPIVNTWTEMANAMYRRVVAIERETSLLIRLRDTLLPKLLTGQLRVRDLAAVVEPVA